MYDFCTKSGSAVYVEKSMVMSFIEYNEMMRIIMYNRLNCE